MGLFVLMNTVFLMLQATVGNTFQEHDQCDTLIKYLKLERVLVNSLLEKPDACAQ